MIESLFFFYSDHTERFERVRNQRTFTVSHKRACEIFVADLGQVSFLISFYFVHDKGSENHVHATIII